jgi:hypothetical protein
MVCLLFALTFCSEFQFSRTLLLDMTAASHLSQSAIHAWCTWIWEASPGVGPQEDATCEEGRVDFISSNSENRTRPFLLSYELVQSSSALVGVV